MPIIKNKHSVDDQDVIMYMEVDELPNNESYYEDMRGTGNRAVECAHNIFGEGLQLAKNSATQVVTTIGKMNDEIKPDEFTLKLAIKADMHLGAVLTKIGTEAQMEVTMKWKKRSSKK